MPIYRCADEPVADPDAGQDSAQESARGFMRRACGVGVGAAAARRREMARSGIRRWGPSGVGGGAGGRVWEALQMGAGGFLQRPGDRLFLPEEDVEVAELGGVGGMVA